MDHTDLTLRHSALLQRLAEPTEAVLEIAHLRVMAAGERDFPAEVAVFSDLGRALRLTLALGMRLVTLAPRVVPETGQARPERAIRPERLNVERETEVETDGHPATALRPLGQAWEARGSLRL